MMDDSTVNKLDPRVTRAIEQSADFISDALPDDAVNQLLAFSEGLDMFDRLLVLKRAICLAVAFREIYRDRDARHLFLFNDDDDLPLSEDAALPSVNRDELEELRREVLWLRQELVREWEERERVRWSNPVIAARRIYRNLAQEEGGSDDFFLAVLQVLNQMAVDIRSRKT